MGRPLNKKFFGNRNIGSSTVTTDDGIGGQGVGSVVVSGTFSGKTTTVSGAANPYTIPASVISAPQLPGGVKPTLTITFATASTATVTVVDSGSGYTAVPTISGAALQALGGGAGTVVLTAVLAIDSGSVGSATNDENAITITAWVPATGAAGNITGNGTSAVTGDIVRQCGSDKYIVRTAQGLGRVKLVAGTPAAGQATIIATDSAGGTYYVTELRAHKAHIINGDQTGTQFTTGTDGIDVPWTFNTTSPSTKIIDSQPYLAAGVNVQISNA